MLASLVLLAAATLANAETYVPFSALGSCPPLSPHEARDARDVRLDDVRVVMALGDSITAGFLATEPEARVAAHDPGQTVLGGLCEL